MKLITEIEKQKRNKTRYNIYLDSEYTFSCNEELVVKLKLKVGKNINEEELCKIIQEDNLKESFNTGLNYLTARSRTKQEVVKHLLEKGYNEDVISQTIERLKGYQFINDEKYTFNFIRNRSQSQLKGKRLIRRELSHKGVEEKIIQQGLDSYSPADEIDNAIKIGRQYFISKKNLPFNQIKQKLSNKLTTKGYTWEIISEVLKTLEMDSDILEIMEDQQEVHFNEAQKAAEKYYEKHQKKEKDPYLLKKKVGAFLYQKGFDQDLIQRVLDLF